MMFRKKNYSFLHNKLLLAEIIQTLNKLQNFLPLPLIINQKEEAEKEEDNKQQEKKKNNENHNNNNNNNNNDNVGDGDVNAKFAQEKSVLNQLCMSTDLDHLSFRKLIRMRAIYRILLVVLSKHLHKSNPKSLNSSRFVSLIFALEQIGGNVVSAQEIITLRNYLLNENTKPTNTRPNFVHWCFDHSFIFRFPKGWYDFANARDIMIRMLKNHNNNNTNNNNTNNNNTNYN